MSNIFKNYKDGSKQHCKNLIKDIRFDMCMISGL